MELIILFLIKIWMTKAKEIAMYGCGEEIFDVDWNYKRGAHEGVYKLKTTWPGFLHLVED